MTDRPDDDEGQHTGETVARLRALMSASVDRLPAGDALSAVYAVRRRARWRRVRRVSVAGGLTVGLAGVLVLVSLGRPASPPSGPPAAAMPLRLTGALTSFDGCSGYLAYVKQRATALVGPYGLQTGYPYAANRVAAGAAVSDQAAPVPASPNKLAAGGAAVAYSGTTDQVAGVDEPDTVKADGRQVVTLTGPTLRVLDTSAQVLGSLTLVGDTGGGMLLVGDRAVVLSSAPGESSGYGPIVAGGVARGYAGVTSAEPQSAQAAVVDLSDPSHPRLQDTFSFDGSVVAARLVGSQVRLVLRSDGPRLTFQTATSPTDDAAATTANKALIASSTLGDWLPSWQLERPDGSTTARHQLSACDAVARPQHATGISTVSVLSLDPQASAPGPATSVVAAGDTVYATADHLVVGGQITAPPSTPSTAPRPGPAGGPAPPGGAVTCCVANRPGPVTTWLYEFQTTGVNQPAFLGAGSVPGSLLDSYAIDQAADGNLRVATTTTTASDSTDSRITVLGLSGHTLTTLGVVDGLGQGQQLRAVRFLGDQAYVVTYRSFDPLYVVDLSNPRKPAVTGQLEQPGFSEFLYPLPDHRLLGVGVQVTNGEASGLEVATYDVSDPAHPHRIAVAPLASGFFPANQGYDPHAFLYWQPDHLAVLAVPDGINNDAPTAAVAYQIATNGHLTKIATLGHDALTTTRTAVIGNAVWAFTPAGIAVANLTSLDRNNWHPYL
jgi:uncharacterized secreted protein with C-terminal beta-propeller domain